jgi:hypothetical protein
MHLYIDFQMIHVSHLIQSHFKREKCRFLYHTATLGTIYRFSALNIGQQNFHSLNNGRSSVFLYQKILRVAESTFLRWHTYFSGAANVIKKSLGGAITPMAPLDLFLNTSWLMGCKS